MPSACGYTHDISGERFDDIEGETWTCTRTAADAADRCVFHASRDLVADEVVRDRLLAAITEGGESLRLIGARLGAVKLDYATLDGPSNHPIDLREATVTDDLSIRYATVKRPLRLEGATFRGAVDFEDTTLFRRVDFGSARFAGRLSFRMADFKSWLDLRDADVRGPAYMRVARFRRGIYGIDVTFHSAADFLNTRFDDVANFYRAEFASGAVFDSSTFAGNAQFTEATFGTPTVKLASATGSPRSDAERLEAVALSMDGVTCERNFRLIDATIAGDVAFTDSDLGRDLECSGLSSGDDAVVDCTGTAVVSGAVSGDTDTIRYDLTDAEVGEIDITDDSTFDVFRFATTIFSGFDFSAYKRDLASRNWQLHDTDADHDPERLENLYLRAKNGAKEIGENRAAAEFFIREMLYRRAGHRQRARRADGIRERASAVGDWLANALLQLTCGYGERPFRPVLFSVGLIVLFAVTYAVLGTPIRYTHPFGYLVFSTEAFVTLVLGLPRVTGSSLSTMIVVEAFSGGFMIAIFVFTLTRSISR